MICVYMPLDPMKERRSGVCSCSAGLRITLHSMFSQSAPIKPPAPPRTVFGPDLSTYPGAGTQ